MQFNSKYQCLLLTIAIHPPAILFSPFQMELILWQLRGIQDAWNNITVKNSKTFTDDYLMGLLDNVFGI